MEKEKKDIHKKEQKEVKHHCPDGKERTAREYADWMEYLVMHYN